MAIERLLTLGENLEFAKNGFISHLKNTEDDQFLYQAVLNYDSDEGMDKYILGDKWFDHTKAKVGQRFSDGNNGDIFRIYYIDTDSRRMMIENETQHKGMYEVWYW